MSLLFIALVLAVASTLFSAYVGLVRRDGFVIVLMAILCLGLTVVLTGVAWTWSYRDRAVDCQVTKKWVDLDGTHMVTSANCGILSVKQSRLRFLDYSSEKAWEDLREGQTQRVLIVSTSVPGMGHPCNILVVLPKLADRRLFG
jgi:hypothetical protein